MSKKIAFIGDSYFSMEEDYFEHKDNPNNWTWLLAKKYPQHTYYNYSKGGQSIEYFQRALIDAKKKKCDIVFLVKRFPGRLWVDWQPIEERDFGVTWNQTDVSQYDQSLNYFNMLPTFSGFWLTPSDTGFGGSSGMDFDKNKKFAEEFAKSYRTYIAPSEPRTKWELTWLNTSHNMYNFENLFLVNWSYSRVGGYNQPDELYTNLHSTVGDVLFRHFPENCITENMRRDWTESLYRSGLSLALDDDHLTDRGHEIVCDELILSDKSVLRALSS